MNFDFTAKDEVNSWADFRESKLSSVVRSIPYLVAKALVRYGIVLEQELPHVFFVDDIWEADFSKINFGFSYSYSCFDFYMRANLKDGRVHDLLEYRLIGQREDYLRSTGDMQTMANVISKYVLFAVPGIKQRTHFTVCQSPLHQERVDICWPVADKWFCHDCISRFDVSENHGSSLLLSAGTTKAQRDFAQRERAKMSVALRFSILERDGFRCRACGADPRIDSRVRLHVDHIVPIAKGGKSEPDNLQALCQDCNSGKSDKRVKQMELWDEHVEESA